VFLTDLLSGHSVSAPHHAVTWRRSPQRKLRATHVGGQRLSTSGTASGDNGSTAPERAPGTDGELDAAGLAEALRARVGGEVRFDAGSRGASRRCSRPVRPGWV
jgi:hypothetical protein